MMHGQKNVIKCNVTLIGKPHLDAYVRRCVKWLQRTWDVVYRASSVSPWYKSHSHCHWYVLSHPVILACLTHFFPFFEINNFRTPLKSKLLFEIMPNNFPNYFCVVVFHLLDYRYLIEECRSQWPRGLRRSLRPLTCWDCEFESHVEHGCLSVVIVVCCQVEVSATSWSLVQRTLTDCDASLCVI